MGARARLAGGFASLVALLWISDRLAALSPLPLPGALIGMVLLALLIMVRPRGAAAVIGAGEALLQRYALFFVPAGVGLMTQFSTLQGHWLSLLAALVGSSLLALGVTALTMHGLLAAQTRRTRKQEALCDE